MQKIETSKGILRYGNKTNVFSNEFCKKVRERFGVTRREMSNADIYKVIKLSNIEIGNWIIENPEGFNLYKNMGYLAVSKYTPINLREDREESIERIKASKLPDFLKKRILKKYDNSRNQRHLNLNTYLDYYRMMWFNRNNCASKKAHVYRLEPTKELKVQLNEKAKNGAEYESYKFEDFHSKRINPEI